MENIDITLFTSKHNNRGSSKRMLRFIKDGTTKTRSSYSIMDLKDSKIGDHSILWLTNLPMAGFVFIKMNFSHNGVTHWKILIDFADLEAFAQNNF